MSESFLRVLSEHPPLTLISGLIRVTGQFTEHSATGLVRVTDAVSVSRVLQEPRVLTVKAARHRMQQALMRLWPRCLAQGLARLAWLITASQGVSVFPVDYTLRVKGFMN